MSRVLDIPDIHEPFAHRMARRFCQDVAQKWRCDRINFIGDLGDFHAMSRHVHNPDGHSASGEADRAEAEYKRWHRTFKNATACKGNHDERLWNLAAEAGIPTRYLKTIQECFHTPSWDWQLEHIIDGVLHTHGTGRSGKFAAINLAVERRMSAVMGHLHGNAGIMYHTNPSSRIFGAATGCLIDIKAYAFAYGKHEVRRPVLGCVVVIDGEEAHFVPMPCGRGEKYHHSRAGKLRQRLAISYPRRGR